MKVELTRFRIKKGKEEKAQEWMDFLNSHHEDTVATMKDETYHSVDMVLEENLIAPADEKVIKDNN